jgi:hypothetical protein
MSGFPPGRPEPRRAGFSDLAAELQDETVTSPAAFTATTIHDVPNLSRSIPKRTAEKVSSMGLNISPPFESNE